MSCNYTAVRHKTLKQGRTMHNNRYTLIINSVTLKEKKDEKLLLKLVLSSVFNSERYLFFNINLILNNKLKQKIDINSNSNVEYE